MGSLNTGYGKTFSGHCGADFKGLKNDGLKTYQEMRKIKFQNIIVWHFNCLIEYHVMIF